MRPHLKIFLFPICLLLLPAGSSAQEKNIPQVLFLGDPVQRTIVQAAARELKEKINIHIPSATVNDSGAALARLDELLKDRPWDIIYFNFGIGDLFYKDPATREIRIMNKEAGGVRVSTPAEYEKNLNAVVLRLKATNARLIWGSTTPLVNSSGLFDADSEKEYNAIAARVMAKHQIPVLDLHAHILAQIKPDDKHPPYNKYPEAMQKLGHPLHSPLVNALLSFSKETQ